MKKNSIVQATTTFLLAWLVLNSPCAYAYLDPGTGSVIIQGLIGGIAAAFVIIRVYWHRLLCLLGLRKDADLKAEEHSEVR